MFAGINMFLARLKTHFSPSVARDNTSSEEGQKHIYAREHQQQQFSKHKACTCSFL